MKLNNHSLLLLPFQDFKRVTLYSIFIKCQLKVAGHYIYGQF